MAVRTADFNGLYYPRSIQSPGINAVQKSIGYLASAFMALLLLNLPLHAQRGDLGSWTWPEKPQNIKTRAFTEDTRVAFLRGSMRGFVFSLGVQCSYCHVGEEGKPLDTYNFASDANPNKDRAREMISMLDDINGHLDKIQPSDPMRPRMACYTCHRGVSKPYLLQDLLGKTYREEGLKASLSEYSELKKKYYGTGAYQFNSRVLNGLGYTVLANDDLEGALKVFKQNTKEYPKNGNVWDSLAETYMGKGDMKKAKKYYKKSLKFSPDNQNAKDMLMKIKEGK